MSQKAGTPTTSCSITPPPTRNVTLPDKGSSDGLHKKWGHLDLRIIPLNPNYSIIKHDIVETIKCHCSNVVGCVMIDWNNPVTRYMGWVGVRVQYPGQLMDVPLVVRSWANPPLPLPLVTNHSHCRATDGATPHYSLSRGSIRGQGVTVSHTDTQRFNMLQLTRRLSDTLSELHSFPCLEPHSWRLTTGVCGWDWDWCNQW